MTACCPFCEAVHPIQTVLPHFGQRLDFSCGATALLCAPRSEPATAVSLADLGLRNTYADVVDDKVSVVWGKERRWWRSTPPP